MTYKKYFTLSYDDGVHADKQFLEIINAYGIKCTFNINSGLLPEEDTSNWYVCKNHIKDIYKGHEVATHGYTHPWYNKLNREQTAEDITKDIETLSELMGYPVLGHAYPYGCWTQDTLDVFKEHNIRYARTVRSTLTFDLPGDPLLLDPTCHHGNREVFDLLEKFIHAEPTESDMLFYLWGHSYEFNKGEEFNNWNHLEKICKMISGKNDIVYCTNMEFFDRNK